MHRHLSHFQVVEWLAGLQQVSRTMPIDPEETTLEGGIAAWIRHCKQKVSHDASWVPIHEFALHQQAASSHILDRIDISVEPSQARCSTRLKLAHHI